MKPEVHLYLTNTSFFLSELLCFVDLNTLREKHVAIHIQSWRPCSKKQ